MNSIENLKLKLAERLEALESRVKAINADITHQNQPLSNDWSEQAVERENEEVLEALGNASQREIAQIKLALQRIEDGKYQICASCQETIPMQRLQLVPFTVHCTGCAEALENQ